MNLVDGIFAGDERQASKVSLRVSIGHSRQVRGSFAWYLRMVPPAKIQVQKLPQNFSHFHGISKKNKAQWHA
jgi:hypothetical protein